MLYHKQIGFPKNWKIKEEMEIYPQYTRHAETRAYEKYGIISLPKNVIVKKEDIFEIEADKNNKPIKVCFRIKWDNEYDICYAMILSGSKVKTVWLNKSSDRHYTLDTSKYDKP